MFADRIRLGGGNKRRGVGRRFELNDVIAAVFNDKTNIFRAIGAFRVTVF